VAESALPAQLAQERGRAVRILLGRPLVDVDVDPDDFRLVARHRDWLVEWFESGCGWQLAVDISGGFARLTKRGSQPDHTRAARRTRGAAQPFDRRRYELLCLLCAELASRAMTTIGILASDLQLATSVHGIAGRLDTSKQRERVAFVDALKLLAGWGVVRFEGGDVDAYVGDASANAIIVVDVARLHRLPATAATPSAVTASTTSEAIDRLTREPRYGEAPEEPALADEEQRLRWTRHSLLRCVIDDPVVYYDDLPQGTRDYLANPSGRRWMRDRLAEVGFELEERAEGLIAVDPEELATDISFPGAGGTIKQTALLLIDCLVSGQLLPRARAELVAHVRGLLDGHPNWAKEYQDRSGADRLLDAATELLAQFRLIVRGAGEIIPRPAIARYGLLPAGKPLGDEGGSDG
jgi:uncharacterized protein (TIGR02678 family)